MKAPVRRGVRFLVVVMILSTCLVLITLLSLTTRGIFENEARSEMKSTSQLLLSSLDWAVAPLLKSGDLSAIQRLLENFADDRSVGTVRLVDHAGLVLAGSRQLGGESKLPDMALDLVFSRQKLMTDLWTGDNYFAAIPVRGQEYSQQRGSDVVAVLILGLRAETYLASYGPFNTTIIVVASLAVALFGGILLMFLQRWIFRPLKDFQAAALQLRDGDYQARVVVSTTSEMWEFADVFNRMAEEVGTKEVDLERRVEARTAELTHALANLEKTRDALVSQEKMASIGRLAAGIAHEINNPTAYILSNFLSLTDYIAYLSTIIEAGLELGRKVREHETADLAAAAIRLDQAQRKDDLEFVLGDLGLILSDSASGATRIKQIVDGLKSFARGDSGVQLPCDLNELIRTSMRMVDNKLKYKGKVVADLGALPPVLGVAGKLEQVFVNLLTNAGDAIQELGVIEIRSWAAPGEVFVSVRDNGSGMDSVTIARIFEPFYTTKDVGRGTGLGLSISLGIIQEHGGALSVESVVGVGTTFTIRLPLL
ncbi:MAG: ATP-binding protein [Spirochaetales bacterium]